MTKPENVMRRDARDVSYGSDESWDNSNSVSLVNQRLKEPQTHFEPGYGSVVNPQESSVLIASAVHPGYRSDVNSQEDAFSVHRSRCSDVSVQGNLPVEVNIQQAFNLSCQGSHNLCGHGSHNTAISESQNSSANTPQNVGSVVNFQDSHRSGINCEHTCQSSGMNLHPSHRSCVNKIDHNLRLGVNNYQHNGDWLSGHVRQFENSSGRQVPQHLSSSAYHQCGDLSSSVYHQRGGLSFGVDVQGSHRLSSTYPQSRYTFDGNSINNISKRTNPVEDFNSSSYAVQGYRAFHNHSQNRITDASIPSGNRFDSNIRKRCETWTEPPLTACMSGAGIVQNDISARTNSTEDYNSSSHPVQGCRAFTDPSKNHGSTASTNSFDSIVRKRCETWTGPPLTACRSGAGIVQNAAEVCDFGKNFSTSSNVNIPPGQSWDSSMHLGNVYNERGDFSSGVDIQGRHGLITTYPQSRCSFDGNSVIDISARTNRIKDCNSSSHPVQGYGVGSNGSIPPGQSWDSNIQRQYALGTNRMLTSDSLGVNNQQIIASEGNLPNSYTRCSYTSPIVGSVANSCEQTQESSMENFQECERARSVPLSAQGSISEVISNQSQTSQRNCPQTTFDRVNPQCFSDSKYTQYEMSRVNLHRGQSELNEYLKRTSSGSLPSIDTSTESYVDPVSSYLGNVVQLPENFVRIKPSDQKPQLPKLITNFERENSTSISCRSWPSVSPSVFGSNIHQPSPISVNADCEQGYSYDSRFCRQEQHGTIDSIKQSQIGGITSQQLQGPLSYSSFVQNPCERTRQSTESDYHPGYSTRANIELVYRTSTPTEQVQVSLPYPSFIQNMDANVQREANYNRVFSSHANVQESKIPDVQEHFRSSVVYPSYDQKFPAVTQHGFETVPKANPLCGYSPLNTAGATIQQSFNQNISQPVSQICGGNYQQGMQSNNLHGYYSSEVIPQGHSSGSKFQQGVNNFAAPHNPELNQQSSNYMLTNGEQYVNVPITPHCSGINLQPNYGTQDKPWQDGNFSVAAYGSGFSEPQRHGAIQNAEPGFVPVSQKMTCPRNSEFNRHPSNSAGDNTQPIYSTTGNRQLEFKPFSPRPLNTNAREYVPKKIGDENVRPGSLNTDLSSNVSDRSSHDPTDASITNLARSIGNLALSERDNRGWRVTASRSTDAISIVCRARAMKVQWEAKFNLDAKKRLEESRSSQE